MDCGFRVAEKTKKPNPFWETANNTCGQSDPPDHAARKDNQENAAGDGSIEE
jgi:hypothetical protein